MWTDFDIEHLFVLLSSLSDLFYNFAPNVGAEEDDLSHLIADVQFEFT
jgi:hypothetical protein